MIEKATAATQSDKRPRLAGTIGLAFLVVAILILVKAGAPYLFQGATVRSELARQIRETTGLVLTTSNQGRFDLLPTPRIVMRDVHFKDPSGALTIDAGALQGDVRLLPLLVGRLELSSATLIVPKLVIDLDGREMTPDSVIGRALHAGASAPSPSGRRLGVVSLVDATAIVKSRSLGWTPVFDAVNVTIDWPDIGSPATVSGSLMLKDTAADVSLWLAQPSSLMRGETSPLSLRIQSTPLDLSANGDLSTAGATMFHGHVNLRAPSLPPVIALTGARISPPAPFANIVLNSDVTIGVDQTQHTLADLAALRLRLDGNDFEGTLAYQGGTTPALSGTLATDQLSLAPFLSGVPRLLDARHAWSTDRFATPPDQTVALDLRISATHIHAAPLTIDDAAFSVMTRAGRTEVALVEGKAYGGDAKGRASIGVSDGDLSVRGTGSLTDADASALGWDVFGRQVATGQASISATLESNGDTPASIMRHLQGWARATARNGELSGIDIGRGVHAANGAGRETIIPAMRSGRTPFETAVVAARIADGTATLEEGALRGRTAALALSGSLNLGARTLDLAMTAGPPATTKSPRSPDARFVIDGTFDKVVVRPTASVEPPASSGAAP